MQCRQEEYNQSFVGHIFSFTDNIRETVRMSCYDIGQGTKTDEFSEILNGL